MIKFLDIQKITNKNIPISLTGYGIQINLWRCKIMILFFIESIVIGVIGGLTEINPDQHRDHCVLLASHLLLMLLLPVLT